jgi:hypothetical protein
MANDEDADHAAQVEAWLDRTAKGLAPSELINLLERALGALWQRAEVTLGDVTLIAIVDRVLHTASEKYAFLSALEVAKTGIVFEGLRELAARSDSVHEALRVVLVEFLTVLGHLTDEILTPALHAELSRVEPERPGPIGGHHGGPQGARS